MLCWKAGAADFVSKPSNAEILQHRINAHLALKAQAETLQKLAFLDGLTGVYNRRYFDEQLEV